MASRLELLFRRYSLDLERYAPKLRGQFGCPICFGAFSRGPDLGAVVAEEHIVPEALGGRIVTLTCRGCNNTSGSRLESHLVQRVLVDSRKRPVKARVEIGGAVQRAELHVPETKDGAIRLVVVAKRSDPKQGAEAERHLSEGKSDINLRLNFGYIQLRTVVAVVRAAYLMMFRTFGYSYVLDPSAAAIRAQIQNYTEETPVLNGVAWQLPEPVPSGTRVTVMTQPRPIASFIVLLQLGSDPTHIAGVALPLPGQDGSGLYAEVRSANWTGPKTLSPLPSDLQHFLPLRESWQYCLRQSAT